MAPLVLAGSRARHWPLCGTVLMASYLPYVLSGGTDLAALQVFARDWGFNSALCGPLAAVVGPVEATIVLGVGFASLGC